MIKGVSLSGAQVRVVHDDRAAPISPKLSVRGIQRNISIVRTHTYKYRHRRASSLLRWRRLIFWSPQNSITKWIESIQMTVLDC